MDTTIVVALVGAGGTVVGGAIIGPVVGHLIGRRLRAAQATLAEAQTKQMHAEAARIGQDVYQQITADLRAELDRVRTALNLTSAEAERLRQRVTDLESRLAQLAETEQHLAAELRAAQTERDSLRIQLAGREATITALTAQIGDLKAQLAAHQPSSVTTT